MSSPMTRLTFQKPLIRAGLRAQAPREVLDEPIPSTGGAIFQSSAATARTPGILRTRSPRLAGRSLKTGVGTFSRTTITP